MNSLEKLSNGLATIEKKAKFIKQCKDEILSGNVNPLKTEIYLKTVSDVIDEIRKDKEVKEFTMTEAEKYGKSFVYLGNKVEIASKRTFDYSKCGHSEYNTLIKRKKEIEEFLKAIKTDKVFDEETGERINPPTFTSSCSLKITTK